MSATIQPEKILRELSDLWVTLGKDAAAGWRALAAAVKSAL